MSVAQLLTQLFDAERAATKAEEALLDRKPKELLPALSTAVSEAFGLSDEDESALRLRRLAVLLGGVEGAETADLLIQILGHDDPSVRAVAGDELEDRAYERYAEFARAVDRALDRGEPTLAFLELPHLIASVGEPSALLLLRRFLASDDAEVVAEAIGAIVTLGDPAAIPVLEKLAKDHRQVNLADEDEEEAQATLGELAQDAIEELSSVEQG